MNPAGQPASEEKRRRSARSKVLLSATLEWPGRALTATLRNLSEHGAMVEAGGEIVPGSGVIFRRKDLHVHGRVAWVRGKLAGIAFDQPLNADVLLQHVPKPVRREPDETLHRRPGFGRVEMSADEQRWIEKMRPGRRV
jgi:PilZ domain